MRKYHVPFWRAVEEATPSLTLIIQKVGVSLNNVALTSDRQCVSS